MLRFNLPLVGREWERNLLPFSGSRVVSRESRHGTEIGGHYITVSLRVHVPSNHILTQNLYYNHYYPKPKYLIIGYVDP